MCPAAPLAWYSTNWRTGSGCRRLLDAVNHLARRSGNRDSVRHVLVLLKSQVLFCLAIVALKAVAPLALRPFLGRDGSFSSCCCWSPWSPLAWPRCHCSPGIHPANPYWGSHFASVSLEPSACSISNVQIWLGWTFEDFIFMIIIFLI